MAEKKITKREVITMMLAEDTIKANVTYVNYLEHELELLNKKSAQPRKSKVNTENEGYRAIILEVLGSPDVTAPLSLAEIKAKVSDFAEFTPQKLSAIIKPLVDNGTVVKTTEKRISKFSLS